MDYLCESIKKRTAPIADHLWTWNDVLMTYHSLLFQSHSSLLHPSSSWDLGKEKKTQRLHYCKFLGVKRDTYITISISDQYFMEANYRWICEALHPTLPCKVKDEMVRWISELGRMLRIGAQSPDSWERFKFFESRKMRKLYERLKILV